MYKIVLKKERLHDSFLYICSRNRINNLKIYKYEAYSFDISNGNVDYYKLWT